MYRKITSYLKSTTTGNSLQLAITANNHQVGQLIVGLRRSMDGKLTTLIKDVSFSRNSIYMYLLLLLLLCCVPLAVHHMPAHTWKPQTETVGLHCYNTFTTKHNQPADIHATSCPIHNREGSIITFDNKANYGYPRDLVIYGYGKLIGRVGLASHIAPKITAQLSAIDKDTKEVVHSVKIKNNQYYPIWNVELPLFKNFRNLPISLRNLSSNKGQELARISMCANCYYEMTIDRLILVTASLYEISDSDLLRENIGRYSIKAAVTTHTLGGDIANWTRIGFYLTILSSIIFLAYVSKYSTFFSWRTSIAMGISAVTCMTVYPLFNLGEDNTKNAELIYMTEGIKSFILVTVNQLFILYALFGKTFNSKKRILHSVLILASVIINACLFYHFCMAYLSTATSTNLDVMQPAHIGKNVHRLRSIGWFCHLVLTIIGLTSLFRRKLSSQFKAFIPILMLFSYLLYGQITEQNHPMLQRNWFKLYFKNIVPILMSIVFQFILANCQFNI